MQKVIAPVKELQTYLETFSDFEKVAVGHDQPWLCNLRADAFARFCQVGLPTTRDEDWRFTNISAIAQTQFRLSNIRVDEIAGLHFQKQDLAFDSLRSSQTVMIFANGRLVPQLSRIDELPKGVIINGLAREVAAKSSQVENHLGRYLNIQRDAFSALNTAFAEDGAFVHVSRGTVVEQPIYLLFISTATDSTATDAPMMNHPRNLFVVEEEAQVAIVEDYVSLGDTAGSLCNTATELIAKDGAIVSHYMIEREHRQSFNISTLRIEQGRNANVASHSVLLGGGIVRNNVHPVLAGEGSECLINGLFVGNAKQHLDNYMLVEHAQPHCSSRQFYNGILDDSAHGVFHGRIIVHKDAQKTDAKQTNRNLLLSDSAQIDTKPQLEIYADDVKCTHGATIGQIEENALFYLRSRGIDEASARKLLLMAFANECLDRMREDSVRNGIEKLLSNLQFGSGSGSKTSNVSDGGRNWQEVG
ncbi:MAG TPA: Fe-S cluster assembly protein SufD [Terriglobales bacterium]|nr:Fe-S cluster assembly protein SufD [Terriglobales bacterium]